MPLVAEPRVYIRGRNGLAELVDIDDNVRRCGGHNGNLCDEVTFLVEVLVVAWMVSQRECLMLNVDIASGLTVRLSRSELGEGSDEETSLHFACRVLMLFGGSERACIDGLTRQRC